MIRNGFLSLLLLGLLSCESNVCQQNSCLPGPCGEIVADQTNVSIANLTSLNLEEVTVRFVVETVAFSGFGPDSFEFFTCWAEVQGPTVVQKISFIDDSGEEFCILPSAISIESSIDRKENVIIEILEDNSNGILTYSANQKVYRPCNDTPCG